MKGFLLATLALAALAIPAERNSAAALFMILRKRPMLSSKSRRGGNFTPPRPPASKTSSASSISPSAWPPRLPLSIPITPNLGTQMLDSDRTIGQHLRQHRSVDQCGIDRQRRGSGDPGGKRPADLAHLRATTS